ncbi:hypothetical protein [Musicola paradisiaca]|nr:hypothetical protein [Musicola paradisiaca]
MKMHEGVKKGLCGLLLALPLYGFADAANPDLIAGYTTQQLADKLPVVVDGLNRRSANVDAHDHTVEAEYMEAATKRKALVTLYTLPADKNGRIPEARDDSDLEAVVASAEKEMLRQRIRPEKIDLAVEGVPKIRCLRTLINNQVVHLLCASLVKGRVMEIQPVSLVDDKAFDAAMQRSANLVMELNRSVAAPDKK